MEVNTFLENPGSKKPGFIVSLYSMLLRYYRSRAHLLSFIFLIRKLVLILPY